eukprot:g6204.t1
MSTLPQGEVCTVCQRRFKSVQQLETHRAKSELHKRNLAAAAAAGGGAKEPAAAAGGGAKEPVVTTVASITTTLVRGRAASSAPAASDPQSSTSSTQSTEQELADLLAKRPRRFSEKKVASEASEDRRHQDGSRERRSGSRSRTPPSRRDRDRSRERDHRDRDPSRERDYRDRDRSRERSKERSRSSERDRERRRGSRGEDGSDDEGEDKRLWKLDHSIVGSVREARAINNNLDWKCGSCQKVNFARYVVCGGCGHSVDQHTTYLDGSEKREKRFALMMRIAKARVKLGQLVCYLSASACWPPPPHELSLTSSILQKSSGTLNGMQSPVARLNSIDLS